MDISRPRDWYRPREERIQDWREVEAPATDRDVRTQAERCMDCGIPFCHGGGCPLSNAIPDINRLVSRGDWRGAWELLALTSPMPEFTARVCPALCENSCCASVDFDAVAIRQIEKAVVERAFANDWVRLAAPSRATGARIAVVGSGPAGLAAAMRLRRYGHRVTVYEKNPLPGGLLRYGIPAFKLDRAIIDRRVATLLSGGVEFHCDTEIGRDISPQYLADRHDAVIIATGTPLARDLAIPGRDLAGIHFALDFLNGGVDAAGMDVAIIGGGDTGADCLGAATRWKAKSVAQLEIMPEPPATRSPSTPWPDWSYHMRSSSSHREAGVRVWSVQTLRFIGENGRLTGIETRPVRWTFSPLGKPISFEPAGDAETRKADIALLAMGFQKPEHSFARKNIFIVGDAANGQSLVVRAIADALRAVEHVERFLESV